MSNIALINPFNEMSLESELVCPSTPISVLSPIIDSPLSMSPIGTSYISTYNLSVDESPLSICSLGTFDVSLGQKLKLVKKPINELHRNLFEPNARYVLRSRAVSKKSCISKFSRYLR